MAQGEESNLAGIREGDEREEFGEMEVGPTDGRMSQRSPIIGRALDDSLRAAQGTPGVVQMEAEMSRRYIAQMEDEIARRVEAEMTQRGVARSQQQHFMADALSGWGDVRNSREVTEVAAQFADADVNVQGVQYVSQYTPPTAFGRAGPVMGSVSGHNPYRASVGGRVTSAAFHAEEQQQWLPGRIQHHCR